MMRRARLGGFDQADAGRVGMAQAVLPAEHGQRMRVVRVARGRQLQVPDRFVGPVEHRRHDARVRAYLRVAGRGIQGLRDQRVGLRDGRGGILGPLADDVLAELHRERGAGDRIVGLDLQRLLQHGDDPSGALDPVVGAQRLRRQHPFVRREIEASGATNADGLGRVDLGGDRRGDAVDHVFLDLEEAVDGGFVFFRPQQHVFGGIAQVGADPDAVPASPSVAVTMKRACNESPVATRSDVSAECRTAEL